MLALKYFHEQTPTRGGGGHKAWSVDEDACILHNVHGPGERVSWAKLATQLATRKEDATKKRYRDYLKPNVVDVVGAGWEQQSPSLSVQVDAAELERRLNVSYSISLPVSLRRSLVMLHATTKDCAANSSP